MVQASPKFVIPHKRYKVADFCSDSWPSNLDFPPGSSVALWSSQNTLRNLQFYQGSWLFNPAATTKAIKTIENVNHIRVTPNDYEGLKHIYLIFKNRRIAALHLDLRTFTPDANTARTGTPGPAADQVTAQLFAHLMPIVERTLSLTQLTLWNVDLTARDGSWIRLLDHKILRKLELVRCPQTGRFLRGLINHPKSTGTYRYGKL